LTGVAHITTYVAMALRQPSKPAAKKRSKRRKAAKRIWSKADIRTLKGLARKSPLAKIAKTLKRAPDVAARLATIEALNRSRAKAVEELRQRAVSSESTAGGGVEVVQKGIESAIGDFEAISTLLGGRRVLGSKIASDFEAHELINRGLPGRALTSLIETLHIPASEVSEAVGLSLRTVQRHISTPGGLLDAQQSGRAWKFAEVVAKATRVLGSQDEAEQWLKRPAIGLDQQRPIALLTTPAGVKLVDDYLGRLEYDVYT
jgi:putative toxin-antitoxin system antitoxin component (TIGR02293 family)